MATRPWQDESAREGDARFPSGRWVGFWRQDIYRGRMELDITFGAGRLFGDGRDCIGDFVLSGHYDGQTGKCCILKAYLGQHEVEYDGTATADGIRGVWRIRDSKTKRFMDAGPFHIWPASAESGEALRTEVARPVGTFVPIRDSIRA